MLDRAAKQVPCGSRVWSQGRGLKYPPERLEADHIILHVGVRAKYVEGHVERLGDGR